jgi:glycerophosphoryl diester phosphodiesterase
VTETVLPVGGDGLSVRCFAHRGFAGVNPENTIPAVRRAVDTGADGVEIDVRECGTGELVVVHDATVDRVTETLGRVEAMPLSTLESLDVLGTGRGVPTLAAVLDVVPADCVLNIELKGSGFAERLLRAVADAECELLCSSFETGALDELNTAGDVPLALLCRNLSGNVETAAELGCCAIHPHEQSCDSDSVATAQSAGLRVNAWTVRSRETARRLATAGVDGLIADAPAYCRSDK